MNKIRYNMNLFFYRLMRKDSKNLKLRIIESLG